MLVAPLTQAIKTILLSLTLLSMSIQVNSATSNKQIESNITTLTKLIEKAASKGLDIERERMALHTSLLGLRWALWDEKNVATNAKYYAEHPWFKKNAMAHAIELPQFERDSINEILMAAIKELKLVESGKIVRSPVRLVNYEKVVFKDNQLLMDGTPVFTSGYTWKPETPELTKYYGNLAGYFLAPSFIKNKQGALNKKSLKRVKERERFDTIGHTFISHNAIPKWALTEYPDLQVGQRLYSAYDIDHPAAKHMYSALFKNIIPKIQGSRGTQLGYMLANEPSFHTQQQKWNTGVVSEYTFAKFREWLREKHGTIEKLNTLWQKDFQDFNNVTLEIPISSALRGSPIWYDWCRFNQARVSEWFAFLKGEIKKYDINAKTHIKLMPHLWLEDVRDHGLDYEQLLLQGDMIGFDAQSGYSTIRKQKPEWMTDYSFNWQGPAMSFDFFSSIQPDQLLYDTENHYFTSAKFMENDIDPAYIRSMYWLAFTHGQSSTYTWVWARKEDGSIIENRGINKEFIVDVTHQPKGLHALTRVLMDLNAHADDVVALQKQKKPIRLFYSETSAINQSDYMQTINETYQRLYFNGIALGFATENILSNQANDWKIVVIRDAKKITQAELNALQVYLDQGGIIVSDKNSLTLDQYGRVYKEKLRAGTDQLHYFDSLDQLEEIVASLTKKHKLTPSISVNEDGQNDKKHLAWRTTTTTLGRQILSIINTSKTAIDFTIHAPENEQKISINNLFTGEIIPQNQQLKSRDMLFVEVRNL